MAKRLGNVKAHQEEGNGVGENGKVIAEGKPLGARDNPELAEKEFETGNKEEGGEGAPLLHPSLDPNFVVSSGRKDRDDPDVREQGLEHIKDPRRKGNGGERGPNEVVAHSVEGPLGVKQETVDLPSLGNGLVEIISKPLDMPLAIPLGGEADLVFVNNSPNGWGHSVGD